MALMTLCRLRIIALLATVQLCTVHAFRIKKAARQTMATDNKIIAGIPVYNYHLAHLARSHLRGQPDAISEAKQEELVNTSATDWILMMQPNASDAQIQSFCQEGYRCLLQGRADGVAFVDLVATESDLETLLAKHPGVVDFVEPDLPTSGPELSTAEDEDDLNNTIRQRSNWGLKRIGASTRRRSGVNAHIYVLDTGIRYSHKEFGGRAKPAIDLTSGTLQVCGNSLSCAFGRHSHGTHCAAIAAGKTYGVAPGATIHSAKVLGDNNHGMTSWSISALDWIVRHGKRPAVVSMSLGSQGRTRSRKNAIDRAVKAGITVVVLAGNQGIDACNYDPAWIDSAITVGSIDKYDRRSRFGQGGSNYGQCVDMFAPGSQILSAKVASDTDSGYMSGTSMATPHAAGVAALLLSVPANKNLKPAAVKKKMLEATQEGKVKDAKGSPNKVLQTHFA